MKRRNLGHEQRSAISYHPVRQEAAREYRKEDGMLLQPGPWRCQPTRKIEQIYQCSQFKGSSGSSLG